MLIFHGGGVMAEAILRRLLAEGYDPDTLAVIERRAERVDELAGKYAVRTAAAAAELDLAKATVILAVKPQDAAVALTELAAAPPALLISICAGLTTAYLEARLGGETPVVRAMPNTPALIGHAMTALVAGKHAGAEHLRAAEKLFACVGQTAVLAEERLMDAVTALSGSGPAYLFALARDLVAAGVAQGLAAPVAAQLAQQTLIGAAQLWRETELSPEQLIAQVKSKRGTTEAALNVLAEKNWSGIMHEAVAAAAKRANELATEAR